MKHINKYLAVFFCIAIAMQGCVKIESELAPCAQSPSKPNITNGPEFTVNVGSSFSVNLSNYTYSEGMYLYLIAPDGKVAKQSSYPPITMYSDITTLPGTYKLVHSNSSGTCHSDTATFKLIINYSVPSCAISSNNFQTSTGNPLINFLQGTGSYQSGYFSAVWNNGTTYINVKLGYKPTTEAVMYNINSRYYTELEGYEAQITTSNSNGTYYATGGQVYVRPITNDVMEVKFCGITFEDGSGYTVYYSARGQLQYTF